ncbi:MAG: exodeoxyribonuclease I [Methylomicrobium sp.]
MSEPSLYWHDYETYGTDPRRDRPAQFAGLRTDYQFNIIGEPLVVYCKLADDCLPEPLACLITGITPQIADSRGVSEAQFADTILREMAKPGTCVLGYNNLRFDDEVTRHLLYRNLFDPYQREWDNGNSRWDLIDVVRAAYALRPDGIEWPKTSEGLVTFRLEELTKANGIEHEMAHDALSDVYATIAVAKLIQNAQPRLYDFLFENRGKAAATRLLRVGQYQPIVHVSGKYPSKKHSLAVVLPICPHPTNNNGFIVYDLSADPEALLTLSVEEIKQRIFTATKDLPEEVDRIPLKTVHVNKCPVLAPINVVRPQDAERLEIDLELCFRHIERIRNANVPALSDKIAAVFEMGYQERDNDPDLMLYSGGFFAESDKREMARIHKTSPDALSSLTPTFYDDRLTEMFFRYRARNFPHTLSSEEREKWRQKCCRRLLEPGYNSLTFQEFIEKLNNMSLDSSVDPSVVSALREYADSKASRLAIELASYGV